MELDVAAYRRVAEKWAIKDEDINPSAAAVLMLQMCSELERLQKADYEFQAKLADGITDAFLDRRWMPVSERLPEPNEPVLIYTAVLGRHVASVDEEGEWFCDYGGEWLFPDVTHWMPLPEPPEVK
jgi:hypothetical protein